MCHHTNSDTDFFKIFAIISPFVSAALTGLITYTYTLKTKRFDLLYQNKVPAFKDIATKLTEFKKYCIGRSAFLTGAEFSPYWEENVGALHHKAEIANISELNMIFLSPESKKAIDKLINSISSLTSLEPLTVLGETIPGIENEYNRLSELTEKCIEILYKDLNLKN